MKNWSKKKKISIIVSGIIILLLMYPLYVFMRVRGVVDEAYTPLETEDIREEEIELGADPFSTLVMGIDRDSPTDVGRSDTMMLITVNPRLGTTYILSIARDTMVTINGRQTRINHAYAYGGPELSINTVQELLNVPIDRYVEISMDSFATLVDAVGGITVYNDTVAFTRFGHHFSMGYNELNGENVLAFVTMRKEDPEGDYGRQARQRIVMAELMNTMVGSALTNHMAILNAAGDGLKTDISFGDVTTIALNYAGALGRIENLYLRGRTQMINGMSLEVMDQSDIDEVSETLRNHLELD